MNIQGNENADKAAKSAAARNEVDFKSIPYLDTNFIPENIFMRNFEIIGVPSQLIKN